MVNYAVAAGGSVSISNLFAAGFGPGILVGLVLMVICYFSSKKYGYGQKNRVPFSLHNVGRSFVNAIWALIMPVIVLGGIYGGIFTPTEAAAVAAIYGFIVGTFVYQDLS